ncbi:MAG: hypothetical protein J5662_09620 [Clostridia bacterium]|nr:hypothetical protein [Clostridia bacterium]
MGKKDCAKYLQKAKEILSKMTLDDKILQMSIYGNINKAYEEFLKTGKPELRAGTFHSPAEEKNLNEMQDYCLNKTELGIPLLPAA